MNETNNNNQAGIQSNTNGEVIEIKCPSCKHTKDKCECGTPEIWTEEKSKEKVEDILKEIRDNKDIIYIGEILDDHNLSKRQWSYLNEKYEKCQVIKDSFDKIKTILESRINTGGLRGDLKEGMTKFNLINNYDWKERNETDITTKGKSLNSLKDLSDAELESIISQRRVGQEGISEA